MIDALGKNKEGNLGNNKEELNPIHLRVYDIYDDQKNPLQSA